MSKVDFASLIEKMRKHNVIRPNAATSGTLSGHAAGEPFEKDVYKELKVLYADKIFKQYEYLNDIFLRNPKHITIEQRNSLFNSPTALFLLSRGNAATEKWSPSNVFEEKQNDTADILFCESNYYDLIDVKTRNMSKTAMPPNIISAYKLAKMCALMIDNNDFDVIDIDYVEIDWVETSDHLHLHCIDAHHANLFKSNPSDLYINWAAAMQVQFHVSDLSQSWTGTKKQWAINYIKMFVASAKARCDKMYKMYVKPFEKYLNMN